MSGTEPVTLSVSELALAVRFALEQTFPGEFWLRGEIADLKRPKSGHVYFSLVEPAADGRPVATVSVALLADRKYVVNQILRRAGGSVRMTDGVEIRLRGRLDYYAPTGRLSVLMTVIDPEYTLGRLVADRDRLVRQLAAEGLLRRQAALTVPLAPLRIGLVTSSGSAAEQDVLHELGRSRFRFEVRTFHAQVQGTGATETVVRALRAAERFGCDVVALVRGGGARTDLATFDEEAVARAVAALGVPVWTGIGHEVDRSVTDEVAHRAFKTPTAVAAALVERVEEFRAGIERRQERLATLVASRLDRAVDGLDSRTARLRRECHVAFRHAEHRLALAAARTEAADPLRSLARGWTITRRTDGRLVRRPTDVGPGDGLATLTAEGTIRSTVDADG